jgi:hypothetical protein
MMPFTFAHPAIVLPLGKIKHASISMSAFIIGSITPDFEYFAKMKLSGRYSHGIEGMFLLDLPMAIFVALIFHGLLKKPLINNLPSYFKSRLQPLKEFNFIQYLGKHYYIFIFSLLVGIASHIVWDSFTHTHAFFARHIDFLSKPISLLGFPTMPACRYLQHISTAVGFIIIGFVFHATPTYSAENKINSKFWIVGVLTSVVAFSIRASIGFEYLGDIVVSIISSGMIGLIASSIFVKTTNG